MLQPVPMMAIYGLGTMRLQQDLVPFQCGTEHTTDMRSCCTNPRSTVHRGCVSPSVTPTNPTVGFHGTFYGSPPVMALV